MAQCPESGSNAQKDNRYEMNELEKRLRSVLNDSSDEENALIAHPFITNQLKDFSCEQCRQLRQNDSVSKSKASRVLKSIENQQAEITKCSSCFELSKRLEFMNDEMNRVCENESKLKETVDTLTCDLEMAQQELSMVNFRVSEKSKSLSDSSDTIEKLKCQLIGNSADRITSLQFELERKVDELQRLGEDHRYLLSLHYPRTGACQNPHTQSVQTCHSRSDSIIDSGSSQKSIEKYLKEISELKLALFENEKILKSKDDLLQEKDLSLEKLNKVSDTLNEQLEKYIAQFDRMQAIVADYKRREDEKFSTGVRDSDIEQLEESYPSLKADQDEEGGIDNEAFFLELDELSQRLEETRLEPETEATRHLSTSPAKKSVTFAVCSGHGQSFDDIVPSTLSRSPSADLNQSKLMKIDILEQRAKAFELRAENLAQELEKVKFTLVDTAEAREDLTELVKVQGERIALFIEENVNLKAQLNRSIPDNMDASPRSADISCIEGKEIELQSMIADIEIRNDTIQNMAKSVSESTRMDSLISDLNLSQNCSEILSGHAHLSHEVVQLTQRLKEINYENEMLHLQVDKAKSFIEELKKQVDAVSPGDDLTLDKVGVDKSSSDCSQLEYMKHENEMLTEKLQLIQEKFEESENDVIEKENQLVKLRQLLETRSQRIKVVEEDLEKKEAKITSYVAMIKKMKENRKVDDESKSVENNKLMREKKALVEEREKLTEQLNVIEEESKSVREQYSELESHMKILETDFDNLESELVSERHANSQLQSELKLVNERNASLTSTIAKLEKDLSTRTVESQNAKSVKWALESEIANLKDEVASLHARIEKDKESPESKILDENKFLKECVDETMDKLASTDGENMKLRGHIDEASQKILFLEKDILLKDDKIDQLQSKVDEIEELRTQVADSEDKRRLLEKMVSEKEQYLNEMNTKVHTFTERNELLENELETAIKNVEVLQTALDTREKELEEINDEINSEKLKKSKLIEQVALLNEELIESKTINEVIGVKTPQKEPLLIDLSTPVSKQIPGSVFAARSFREAKRIADKTKEADRSRQILTKVLDESMDGINLIDLTDAESERQISTSTLCFDLMEKSLIEVGTLEPKNANETVVLDRHSAPPSQTSFINGLDTFSTPDPKRALFHERIDLNVQLLRDNVENKASLLLKQIGNLEVESNGLRDRCSKLEESNESYKNLLKESKDARKGLEMRVLELIQANHDLQNKLSEKIDICAKLTREKDQLLFRFSNDYANGDQVQFVEVEKKQLQSLIDKLKSELNRIVGLNSRLNQELNEMRENMEDVECLESDLDDYKTALLEVESEKLALKSEMEERLRLMSAEVTEAESRLQVSTAKLQRFENMKKELGDINQKYSETCEKNNHLNSEIQNLQDNLAKLQNIEEDFLVLREKNSVMCEELSALEKVVEDQTLLKKANCELEKKCEELCRELERLRTEAERTNDLEVELERIKSSYDEIVEARSADDSLEGSFGQLTLIDASNKARLEELHEEVRRAMETKFQLELDLQQALKCAKSSDLKHQRIHNQLTRIVAERNEIVSRLNKVSRKLNEREYECVTLKERLAETEVPALAETTAAEPIIIDVD